MRLRERAHTIRHGELGSEAAGFVPCGLLFFGPNSPNNLATRSNGRGSPRSMSDRSQFDLQEAFVRRILVARQFRMERSSAAKVRATIGVALAMLRDGRRPTKRNAVDYCDVSRLDMWLLSLAWALHHVGDKATYIMCAHLLNRAKSSEGSWKQIAKDLEMPRADVMQIYVSAVPILVDTLKERDIRENIDDIDSYLTAIAAPYRCAAREVGEPCAMPLVAA